jgi:hypothetical protein
MYQSFPFLTKRPCYDVMFFTQKVKERYIVWLNLLMPICECMITFPIHLPRFEAGTFVLEHLLNYVSQVLSSLQISQQHFLCVSHLTIFTKCSYLVALIQRFLNCGRCWLSWKGSSCLFGDIFILNEIRYIAILLSTFLGWNMKLALFHNLNFSNIYINLEFVIL